MKIAMHKLCMVFSRAFDIIENEQLGAVKTIVYGSQCCVSPWENGWGMITTPSPRLPPAVCSMTAH